MKKNKIASALKIKRDEEFSNNKPLDLSSEQDQDDEANSFETGLNPQSKLNLESFLRQSNQMRKRELTIAKLKELLAERAYQQQQRYDANHDVDDDDDFTDFDGYEKKRSLHKRKFKRSPIVKRFRYNF